MAASWATTRAKPWHGATSATPSERELRRYDESLDAHQRAVDVFGGLGDIHGQATAWNNLGMALRGHGELGSAEEAGKRSVVLFRADRGRLPAR
ncbi:tetratricopeptide repeat protein [Streptomyces sp. NPDC001070]